MADDPMRRLLTAAKLLYANAEGCAVNHYSDDFAIHGLPGWLADCAADIQAAEQSLATPAPSPAGGVREAAELLSHLKLYVLEKLEPADADMLHDRMHDLTRALSPATAAREG